MEKLVSEFINEVKIRGYVSHLFRGSSLSLYIKTESEMVNLKIQNGKIYKDSAADVSPDAVISGSEENILVILTGAGKLRDAIRERKVTVISTFRTVLLLESLFFLSRSREGNII